MGERGRAAVKSSTNKKHAASGFTDIQGAWLTKGDGTGSLLVNGLQDRRIWLHRKTRSSRIRDQVIAWYPTTIMLTPLRDGFIGNEGIKVRIGKPPGIDEFFVIDSNDLEGLTSVGGLSPMEAYINEAHDPAASQLRILRPRPYSPVPMIDLWVDGPFPYTVPSTGVQATFQGGGTNGDLPDAITALIGTGKHQLAFMYFDKELGGMYARTLTAVTPSGGATLGSATARAQFTYTDVEEFTATDSAEIPDYVVYLYDGQSAMSSYDMLFDRRPFLSGGGSGGLDTFDKVGTDASGQIMVDANGNIGLME